MGDAPHTHVIETERAGKLNVYVQGDLEHARLGPKGSAAVFLTVHDIGKNHKSWLNFVFHPAMNNVRERACFIHVDLLGQENDAPDVDGAKFPSMQVSNFPPGDFCTGMTFSVLGSLGLRNPIWDLVFFLKKKIYSSRRKVSSLYFSFDFICSHFFVLLSGIFTLSCLLIYPRHCLLGTFVHHVD